jgi:hypothetical protein
MRATIPAALEVNAMPVIAEQGASYKYFHHGSGYTSGFSTTHDHQVIPGDFSIHTGLSRIVATTDGPVGAAIGIMRVGNQDFGPDPANWPPQVYGQKIGFWTVAYWVNKGDMTTSEFFQIWA